jgi:hypothetical protein
VTVLAAQAPELVALVGRQAVVALTSVQLLLLQTPSPAMAASSPAWRRHPGIKRPSRRTTATASRPNAAGYCGRGRGTKSSVLLRAEQVRQRGGGPPDASTRWQGRTQDNEGRVAQRWPAQVIATTSALTSFGTGSARASPPSRTPSDRLWRCGQTRGGGLSRGPRAITPRHAQRRRVRDACPRGASRGPREDTAQATRGRVPADGREQEHPAR